MVTPVAIYSIGWQYYIVFATIAACVPVSVYFLFPETMGRNLEEIDLVFKRSPSAWATVQFEKSHRGVDLTAEPEGKGDVEAKHEHLDM